jgi:ABC-2 type transport system permease protein
MSVRWMRTLALASGRATVAERGSLAVSMLFYAIVVFVLGGLWKVAADANGGQLAGYTAASLVWYIAASELAFTTIPARLIETTGHDIASGSVAVEMLRPRSVLSVRVVTEVGRTVPRAAACAAVGAAVAWVMGGGPPRASAVALAVPALLAGIVCNIVWQLAFAGLAFWLRDAGATWFLYHKLVFIVGGMLLPLQVLPDWLQSVAYSLPFLAMAYVPARLASGRFEPALLLLQLGWIAVGLVAARAVFASGQRRLQVVGG